jgi:PAT family beta-lactamase induction signal transducer AmpG
MSTPSAQTQTRPEAAPAPVTYKHPLLWVPTSYFAMGTVYVTVTTASNIMFKNLGLPNEQATFYSSITGLAYSFKPLWAPLLELFKTKKFFVVLMQLILAGMLAGVGFALKSPSWVPPVVGMLMLGALAGATMDIATDGVYVTTLDPKRQAAFTGVQSMCWNLGPIVASGVLVWLVGLLAGQQQQFRTAWMYVFLGLGALVLTFGLWHSSVLPQGSKATDAPKSFGDAMRTFGRAFVTFFQKKDILRLIAFAFFYRFGLGLLDKVGPLFLLDSRDNGGLGLTNMQLGPLNGIVGSAALVGGSLIGGLLVSRVGLRRSLLPLCLLLNVPNVTFLYLGMVRPESFWVIGTIIFIEKLGWGIGAVGHMIYMMQQIAPGPYKTAHYAFATGLGLSLCMTVTGMVSGSIQKMVGYQTFFVIVLIAAAPSILATIFAPFNHPDTTGSKA